MIRLVILLIFISNFVFPQQGIIFDEYFNGKTMRIDYYHTGNAQAEEITIDKIYLCGEWAGSRKNLIDRFNNGRYYVKIYDVRSGKLIFSKGFDSYFGEYKTTTLAIKGKKRTYHETVLIPFPKNKIRIELEAREKDSKLKPFFSEIIDPQDIFIIKEKPREDVKVIEVVKNGEPDKMVDMVIVAEGYSRNERKKLEKDLEKFRKVFFSQEPYKSLKNKFNIYSVFKESEESGCDEPSYGFFKNTVLGATFDSLGIERYLLTEENKTLRDIAGVVPYDTILIMVNHKRYGGGGIYNLFCVFTSDNQWYEYLLLHEFGHSFAGLADEYYTSTVAYNEFYPQGIEPTEPNITALLDIDNLKWKDLVSEGVEIPTTWEKEEFDKMELELQRIRAELNEKIAKMKRDKADKSEIEKMEAEAEKLSKEHAEKVDAFLSKSKYAGKVGAFEGAGYSSKGLYRPMVDCIMFSKGKKPYCKVCERAIRNVILSITD
ncbi:MAG: M64 family metallopeptidase [Candidatus Aminicenantia bacterium]